MPKKFIFEAFYKNTVGTLGKIQAAKESVPDWYRKFSRERVKSGAPLLPDGGVNRTVKACVPFLDALTAGYTITLPYDIFVTKDAAYEFSINWNSDYSMVESHPLGQIPKEMIPSEYESAAFKWCNPWVIKTPPGWSTLFVHPLNQLTLPFYTLSGLVDTDTYNVAPVNLPFLLKKDFEGVIRSGTPIAQAIPIKRDSWKAVENPYSGAEATYMNRLRKFIVDSYKKQFWVRKDYE
jgi:hypothetical protein